MIIALPYASNRDLLKIATGALLICAGAVALTLHGSLLPSSLADITLALIILPNIIVVTGLATFGLWHVGSRMRRVQETMQLGPDEIDRIQRYVTPLATVIRNARLFDETRAARTEAIESNQAKSQFLANMSHELRTPLNAIIGYSEMLSEQAEDDDKQEYIEDLERIRKSGLYLLEMINGVLDLTKIEAGKLDVSLSRFDVGDLLNEVVTTFQPLVKKNSNHFEESKFDHLGVMNSDLTKVRQILLSNASKFTREGSITLDAKRETVNGSDWLSFKVTDTGIGIDPEQAERIFDAFAQADGSTSRKYGGTGLGLTISREFCEMLGGNIGVESDPGQGSVFTVRLPAEVAGN